VFDDAADDFVQGQAGLKTDQGVHFRDVRDAPRHVLEAGLVRLVIRDELHGEPLPVSRFTRSASSRMVTSSVLPMLNTSPMARGSCASFTSASTTSAT
jgi:hypothetical protein